jgi:hypothetical protein
MKKELIKVFDGVDIDKYDLSELGPKIQEGYKNVIESLVFDHNYSLDPLMMPVYPPIDFAILCCNESDWINLKPPYDYNI